MKGMLNMKALCKLCGIIVLVLLLAACGNASSGASGGDNNSADGNGETFTIRVAHSSAATDDRLENSLQEFKKAVEDRSEGKIIIETYPNSQLGGEREQLEGVQMGSIEMAVLSTAPFSGFFEKMMILDLPYILDSQEVADAVLDGPFGDSLFDSMLEETGIRGLAWGENGIRHMANNSHPIETPDDVKGLKIRTQENPAHMDMIEAFGGSPTPIAFPELYSSLQQDVIDGYENPFSLIEGMRFYEVTKYISLTSHVNGVYAFIVNDAYFSSLPEDIQTILVEETKNWSDIQRQMNRDQEAAGIDYIKEQGVEVLELTDEQVEEFKRLAEPVVDYYIPKIGEDIYQELKDAIAEVESN